MAEADSGSGGDGAGDSGSRVAVLGLAAVASLCCIGPAAIAGGAAVTGGAASGALFAGGVIESVTAALVTGAATAIPLAVAALLLRWRVSGS